jgi:type IV pilus assembly protein PilW
MGRSAQRGLSIVELMVALALSIMLMAGVVTIFVGSRTSYETTQRLSRIQENGRFALDQIVHDLRAAGFEGCARPNPTSVRAKEFAINTLWNPTTLLWNYAISAEGFNANASNWTPDWSATGIPLDPAPAPSFPGDTTGRSDILVVRAPRRDEPALKLAGPQANPADPIVVAWDASSTIKEKDTLMVSDCDGRAYFRVTSLTPSGGNKQIDHIASSSADPATNESNTLLHPFKVGAEVVPVQTEIFYVANPPPGERPALYRKVGAAAKAEQIAEGVERLEVRYGLDSAGADARVDEYATADAVTDWSQVVTVAVALLVRSPEPYGEPDPRQYDLLGVKVGPINDRYQRQVFTATVALRNHVFD